MAAGLEVYRTNGTVKFSLTRRPFNIFGTFDTGTSNGSFTVNQLTSNGNLNWFEKPLASFNDRIPTFTRSGNVISWTFKASGDVNNVNTRVYYGEW